MDYQILQSQYDKIYFYFKTTTEPFDDLDWDGKILRVWESGVLVEKYRLEDLKFLAI